MANKHYSPTKSRFYGDPDEYEKITAKPIPKKVVKSAPVKTYPKADPLANSQTQARIEVHGTPKISKSTYISQVEKGKQKMQEGMINRELMKKSRRRSP